MAAPTCSPGALAGSQARHAPQKAPGHGTGTGTATGSRSMGPGIPSPPRTRSSSSSSSSSRGSMLRPSRLMGSSRSKIPSPGSPPPLGPCAGIAPGKPRETTAPVLGAAAAAGAPGQHPPTSSSSSNPGQSRARTGGPTGAAAARPASPAPALKAKGPLFDPSANARQQREQLLLARKGSSTNSSSNSGASSTNGVHSQTQPPAEEASAKTVASVPPQSRPRPISRLPSLARCPAPAQSLGLCAALQCEAGQGPSPETPEPSHLAAGKRAATKLEDSRIPRPKSPALLLEASDRAVQGPAQAIPQASVVRPLSAPRTRFSPRLHPPPAANSTSRPIARSSTCTTRPAAVKPASPKATATGSDPPAAGATGGAASRAAGTSAAKSFPGLKSPHRGSLPAAGSCHRAGPSAAQAEQPLREHAESLPSRDSAESDSCTDVEVTRTSSAASSAGGAGLAAGGAGCGTGAVDPGRTGQLRCPAWSPEGCSDVDSTSPRTGESDTSGKSQLLSRCLLSTEASMSSSDQGTSTSTGCSTGRSTGSSSTASATSSQASWAWRGSLDACKKSTEQPAITAPSLVSRPQSVSNLRSPSQGPGKLGGAGSSSASSTTAGSSTGSSSSATAGSSQRSSATTASRSTKSSRGSAGSPLAKDARERVVRTRSFTRAAGRNASLAPDEDKMPKLLLMGRSHCEDESAVVAPGSTPAPAGAQGPLAAAGAAEPVKSRASAGDTGAQSLGGSLRSRPGLGRTQADAGSSGPHKDPVGRLAASLSSGSRSTSTGRGAQGHTRGRASGLSGAQSSSSRKSLALALSAASPVGTQKGGDSVQGSAEHQQQEQQAMSEGLKGGSAKSGGQLGSGGASPGMEGPEAQGAEELLLPCRECGRSFRERVLLKHAKICKKVFGTRRKVYDSTAARWQGTEAQPFVAKARARAKARQAQGQKGMAAAQAPKEGRSGAASGRVGLRSGSSVSSSSGLPEAPGLKGASRPSAPEKVPKWRRQSQEFQAIIRAAREMQAAQASGKSTSSLPPLPPSGNEDYVQCPSCQRHFAPLTAERHIPKCSLIVARPKALVRKPSGTGQMRTVRR